MRDASESAVQAARETVVVVGRLRRILREIASDSAPGTELTPSQTSVLSRISKAQAVTASEVAALERVRPQSVASTVTTLEALGLVRRTPDPADGRRQMLALTATGRRRVEGDRQARRAWLARALDEQFTEAERHTIIAAMALLEKVTEL